ncbi:MAG: transposase, partial [Clostridiaceae bacterium]
MSRKSSYTVEEKIKACTDYLSGFKSASKIAIELNMGKHGQGVVRGWAKKYKTYGASVFIYKTRNNYYSQEFKERVVKEYLNGTSSPNELIIKYNIPSRTTLDRWIKMYNNHIELKEYDPKPEVYMLDTLKTTFEERIEIVKYCFAH